jgi:RND family efflux transporter MFP subunit
MRKISVSTVSLGSLAFVLLTAAASPPTPASAPGNSATQPAGPRTVTLPGNVVPYYSTTLYAKVAGYLKRIQVDKGDQVKTGDLLAEVEVPELLADRTQYQAEVQVAQVIYDRLAAAQKQAPDLVVPETVDEARGKLEVAKAQLQRTETLLNYANIVAPFSGTITARFVDPGAFISQGTNGTQQNTPVVTLMDFHRLRIQVPVPEDISVSIRKGTKADITAQALPGREFHESVTRISYALDPAAKTMLAEIEMDNPGDVLRPGMYVEVRFTLDHRTSSARPQGNRVRTPTVAEAK